MTPSEPVGERTLFVLSFMSVVLVRELSPGRESVLGRVFTVAGD